MPSSTQSIARRIQIGLPDVGLSMVNDRTREELMYISLNKSKVQWVQMRKSRPKPLPSDMQIRLEQMHHSHPNAHSKDPINGFRVRVYFLFIHDHFALFFLINRKSFFKEILLN